MLLNEPGLSVSRALVSARPQSKRSDHPRFVITFESRWCSLLASRAQSA